MRLGNLTIDHAVLFAVVCVCTAAMIAQEDNAGPGPKASRSMPAQASKGDADIALEDGQTFRVHSALLAVSSPVLQDAVHLAHTKDPITLSISMPCTSADELLALLEALYSQRPESHLTSLPLSQLRLLSSICHRFNFEHLLAMLDQALTRHAGQAHYSEETQPLPQQYLAPDNAAVLYWDARAKGCIKFEAACARFIAANMKEVAKANPDDALGPILREAAKCRRPAAQQSAEAHLEKAMKMLNMLPDDARPHLTATSGYQVPLWDALEQIQALGW